MQVKVAVKRLCTIGFMLMSLVFAGAYANQVPVNPVELLKVESVNTCVNNCEIGDWDERATFWLFAVAVFVYVSVVTRRDI